MKLRTTTPASKSVGARFALVIISVVLVIAVPIQMFKNVSADPYDDQIRALQKEVDAYNAQAATLSAQSKTLQNAISNLQNQAAAIQAQINISQAKYDQLVAKIAATEQKIKDNQDALGTTIANMYVDDKVSPLELLAGSKNISDYMDRQEYRASVRDQLTSTIAQVKTLKAELSKQQSEVKAVLDKQQAQKAGLVATQNQQQQLLDETQGQEATYQQLISNSQQKMSDIAARQRAYYQSLLSQGGDGSSNVVGNFHYKNWSGNKGCGSDGYPYCGYQDSYADPWGLYNRECVSYAAWALHYRFGKYVGPFSGHGMAYEWPSSAAIYSGAYRVYDPQPGDAVVLPAMGNFSPVGHLMIVESASDGWIHVSQYNFYGTGEYSTMDIQNSGIVLLRFQDN